MKTFEDSVKETLEKELVREYEGIKRRLVESFERELASKLVEVIPKIMRGIVISRHDDVVSHTSTISINMRP